MYIKLNKKILNEISDIEKTKISSRLDNIFFDISNLTKDETKFYRKVNSDPLVKNVYELLDKSMRSADENYAKKITLNIFKHILNLKDKINDAFKNFTDKIDNIDVNSKNVKDILIKHIFIQFTELENEHYRQNLLAGKKPSALSIPQNIKLRFIDELEVSEIKISKTSLENFVEHYVKTVNFLTASTATSDKVNDFIENATNIISINIPSHSITNVIIDELNIHTGSAVIFTNDDGTAAYGSGSTAAAANVKFKLMTEHKIKKLNNILSEVSINNLKASNTLFNSFILSDDDKNKLTGSCDLTGSFNANVSDLVQFFIKDFLINGDFSSLNSGVDGTTFDTSKYSDIKDSCINKQIIDRLLTKNLSIYAKLENEATELKRQEEERRAEEAAEAAKTAERTAAKTAERTAKAVTKFDTEKAKKYKERDFIKSFAAEGSGYKIKFDLKLLRELRGPISISNLLLPETNKIDGHIIKAVIDEQNSPDYFNFIKYYFNDDTNGFKKHIEDIIKLIIIDKVKSAASTNVELVVEGLFSKLGDLIRRKAAPTTTAEDDIASYIETSKDTYINDINKLFTSGTSGTFSSTDNKEWMKKLLLEVLKKISILLYRNAISAINEYNSSEDSADEEDED